MFACLLNYQEKNEAKRLRVHYWKQVFHILINNTIINLNEYSAGIVLQKKYCYNALLQYTNITLYLLYWNVKIYSTAKKFLLTKNNQSNLK